MRDLFFEPLQQFYFNNLSEVKYVWDSMAT